MNEAALDLPDGAVDRTVTRVQLSTPSGARTTFIVQRLGIAPGHTLRAACLSHVRAAETRVSGYTVLFEREGAVDGAPAMEVGVRWRDELGEPRYTRQAHVFLGGTWLIIAVEGPMAAREELDDLLETTLGSMRIRSN